MTKGFVLLLCGIPVYVGMRWWDRRKAPAVPVAPVTAERPAAMVGGNGAR